MKAMPVQFRIAQLKDAELLSLIGREAFDSAFGAQNNPEDLAVYLSGAFSPKKQADEINTPGCRFLIAESGTDVLGYARLQAGGIPPTCITGSAAIELVRFYLLPAWIGKGFGSTFMQYILQTARGGGFDVIWLSTWQKNTRGLKFYRKWGFEIVGTQTFQIGNDPQDDWLLQRGLLGEGH